MTKSPDFYGTLIRSPTVCRTVTPVTLNGLYRLFQLPETAERSVSEKMHLVIGNDVPATTIK